MKRNGEEFVETIKRELLEETGIAIKSEEILFPFFEIKHYTKNYHNSNKNRVSNVIYYLIKTNQKPNLEKVSLTENEKMYNFSTEYIALENFEKYISSFIFESKEEINKIIAKEILEVFKELENNIL